jgi:hypothetical protein
MLSLLELAADLGNVSKACKVMGYSRQQLYEIRRNFQTYGGDGLIDRLSGPRNPHPNRAPEAVEQAILEYALAHPCRQLGVIGTLDRDGISTMVGLFADPRRPEHNYIRDVHYCSGAALMVRRSALRLLRTEFGSIERGTRPKPEDGGAPGGIREVLDAGERARALLRTNQVGQRDIDRANAFLEMVSELTRKRSLSPITNVIGAALSGIVDRPVSLDDATVGILRTHILHGTTEFLVETHSRGGVAENLKTPDVGDLGGPLSSHPSHPTGPAEAPPPSRKASSRALGGMGGTKRHFPDRPAPRLSSFPEGEGRAPEPPELLPEAEEVPLSKRWSSTSKRSRHLI